MSINTLHKGDDDDDDDNNNNNNRSGDKIMHFYSSVNPWVYTDALSALHKVC